MTDFNLGNLNDVMNQGWNDDLANKETFPPEIQKQIQDTYKKLWEEKEQWLKEQQKNNSMEN